MNTAPRTRVMLAGSALAVCVAASAAVVALPTCCRAEEAAAPVALGSAPPLTYDHCREEWPDSFRMRDFCEELECQRHETSEG
jgi:hypothetical protein